MKKNILKGKKGKSSELPEGGIIDEPATSFYNQTGNWRFGERPFWDKSKCIQCLLCWINCPDGAILIKNQKRVETNLNYCKGCGICAEICPVKAIQMIKENKND